MEFCYGFLLQDKGDLLQPDIHLVHRSRLSRTSHEYTYLRMHIPDNQLLIAKVKLNLRANRSIDKQSEIEVKDSTRTQLGANMQKQKTHRMRFKPYLNIINNAVTRNKSSSGWMSNATLATIKSCPQIDCRRDYNGYLRNISEVIETHKDSFQSERPAS